MKIQRKDLLEALAIVKPGLAGKEIIEQTTSFAFLNGQVITYNDEISIAHPVPGLEISGAVKAEELYKLMSRMRDGEINISATDNEVLIQSGKAKAGLTLQSEIVLPLYEVSSAKNWIKLPDGFYNALNMTTPCCAKDMSRPVLTGVYVGGSVGEVVAADNVKIMRYQIPKSAIGEFIMPGNSAKELLKYTNIVEKAQANAWAHFRTTEGTVFSCRLFNDDDNYPISETRRHLDFAGQAIKLPKNLGVILDRAAVFAKQDHMSDEEVDVMLENKKMVIRGQSQFGWFEEETKVRYDGERILFVAHPAILKEASERINSCVLGDDRMKFVGNDWEHVICLKVQ